MRCASHIAYSTNSQVASFYDASDEALFCSDEAESLVCLSLNCLDRWITTAANMVKNNIIIANNFDVAKSTSRRHLSLPDPDKSSLSCGEDARKHLHY